MTNIIKHQGTVEHIEGTHVQVRIIQTSACSSCSAKSLCHSSESKEKLIDTSRHLVLKSVHPSPLSFYNGFLECRHFSKANEFLKAHARGEIDWSRRGE